MSLNSLRACSRKSLFTTLGACVVAVGAFAWLTSGSLEAPRVAAAQTTKSKTTGNHDAAEHAADTAALKAVFGGATVDLFFELSEVENAKPGLSGLKFMEHVDVTGKELLRFEKAAGESWLIDPDAVFAYRMCKGK
jgi:hypothetical protein